MKKTYLKPEAEVVSLRIREPIADQAGVGSWGESNLGEDWVDP